MSTPLKLNQPQEREVAGSYLCGVPTEFLQENYGVSWATITQSIVGGRSREWNDQLIESFRETDSHNRFRNAATISLAYNQFSRSPLYVPENDKIHANVDHSIFMPAVEDVVERTALATYMLSDNPYDRLIGVVFGGHSPQKVVRSALDVLLQRAYDSSEKLSLAPIKETTVDYITSKVREGGLFWDDAKKSLVDDALGELSTREQNILGLRFGFDEGGKQYTLEEIGASFGSHPTSIRQIEAKALRTLRHPSISRSLAPLIGLFTPADAQKYAQEVKQAKEREYWKNELRSEITAEVLEGSLLSDDVPAHVDELELSVRSYNALRDIGIETTAQLVGSTEADLFKSRTMGRKALNEIKTELGKFGLSLRREPSEF